MRRRKRVARNPWGIGFDENVSLGTAHAPRFRTAEDVKCAYREGRRIFFDVEIPNGDFSDTDLSGARFLRGDLRGGDFSGCKLSGVQFKSANLDGAAFAYADLNGCDLIDANCAGADFCGADFTGSSLFAAVLVRTDLSAANLNNVRLGQATLLGAKLSDTNLYHADFSDCDVGPFCDAPDLRHGGPSTLDPRTVMRSAAHPGLKRFMIDCGVPEIFAEYMIDCAKALDNETLRTLMQSTFISYGGPDEAFARKLYDALRAHGVVTYFFPVSATVGERINNEVFRQLQEHDRVLLVCSQQSLDRVGVVNEIQETLDREAKHGGATYLLPIMLDDYVLKAWSKSQPALSERISRRVIADFRGAKRNRAKFDAAVGRVLDALKKKRPAKK